MFDIYQTIDMVKSGLYYLGLLVGVHVATVAGYFVYQQFSKDINNNTSDNVKSGVDMEELNDVVEDEEEHEQQVHEYKLLLEKKKEELTSLISQLDTVYDNIGEIRERLDNLNSNKSSV